MKQYFSIVPCKQRLVVLAAFLRWKVRDSDNAKAIVFVSSRELANFYHRMLSLDLSKWYILDDRHIDLLEAPICGSTPLFVLHGGMTQQERSRTFTDFSATKKGVLISTDVAARGLHLPKVCVFVGFLLVCVRACVCARMCVFIHYFTIQVTWIVQTSIPVGLAEYIHRVGRTARLDSSGQALMFVMPEEVKFLDVLREHHVKVQEIKSDVILSALASGTHKSGTGSEEATRCVAAW